MRIGFGYDSHRLVEGRELILGGVAIPYEKGLAGHSDADAVFHAIGDAILGAIGEQDIGTHFPDSDPAYKDISSRILLEKIYTLMRKKNFAVNNLDITILLERPKLASYIPEMKRKLEAILALSDDCISIKAKTNEGMGFVGRGEGIAVFAIVTVEERAAHGNE